MQASTAMKAMKDNAVRRPAVKAMKATPASEAKKKPKVKKEVKTEVKPIPHFTTRAQARCPKKGDGPDDYKGGRIYTSIPAVSLPFHPPARQLQHRSAGPLDDEHQA